MVPTLKSLHRLNHHCTGCGRSCEGPMVPQRPLDDAFLDALDATLAALAPHHPGLTDPLTDADGTPRLRLTAAGRCVFLAEDQRCAIVAHVGRDAMPLACRMFPLRIVETEAGLRLGASPTCYEAHRTRGQTGPASPFTLLGYAPGELPTDLLVAHGAMPDHEIALEARLLRLLSQLETGVEAILATVAHAALGGAPIPTDAWLAEPTAAAALADWLQAVSQRLTDALADLPEPAPDSHRAALLALASDAASPRPIPSPSLPRADRDALREALSQYVFTRSHVGVMPLAVAVTAIAAGAVQSGINAATAAPAEAAAVFSRSLATWFRAVGERPMVFTHAADPLDLLRALVAARHDALTPPLDRLFDTADGLSASRGGRTFLLDLNHHVAHGLFAHLAPFERRDERLAYGRTYAGFDQLDAHGFHHLAPSLLQTTSAGKVFFERFAMAHLPTIPTALFDHGDLERLRAEVRALLPPDLPARPSMMVRKNLLSHRGEGVQVFRAAELDRMVEQAQAYDLFQPFITCGYPDGHQRNFRAILVDDDVALLYERKAPQPLLINGELATFPPDGTRVLTNSQYGGQLTVVDPAEHPEVVDLARRARSVFRDAEQAFRARQGLHTPFAGATYLSVDTFRGESGDHYFNELHLSPELVHDDHLDRVTDAMVRHIAAHIDAGHVTDVFMIGRENLAPFYRRKLEAAGIVFKAMERLVE